MEDQYCIIIIMWWMYMPNAHNNVYYLLYHACIVYLSEKCLIFCLSLIQRIRKKINGNVLYIMSKTNFVDSYRVRAK